MAGPVLKHQPPTVVLHDLFHNGKSEAGALGLVRDVRLGEAVALVSVRQAEPVVLDGDGDVLLARLDAHGDVSRGLTRGAPAPGVALLLGAAGDGVGGVLQ